jgi:hypothetical protein
MAAYKYKKKTYPNNIIIIFLIKGRTGGQVDGWIDGGCFVMVSIHGKAGLFVMTKTRKEKKW